MSPDDRRKLLWELRQDGMTLAAIGKKIGRSQEQVRVQIFIHNRLEQERLQRQAMMNGLTRDEVLNSSVLNLELNVRARNHFSWSPSVTVADIMAMSDEELHAPNMGKVTIALIRAAINTALANAEKADQ
jgi:DNA-directed RNA polymerase alpha subunit